MRSERLLAELCGRQFLHGFVFHSPKYYDPTEKEAGDVVLWIRRQIIVLELLTRCSDVGASTKHFVKNIGAKRNQLVSDFSVFNDPNVKVELQNEYGETVAFAKPDVFPLSMCGIVLVDSTEPLASLHYQTVEKSLVSDHPIAIMTVTDFRCVLDEVDTIPDLVYYLNDRFAFMKRVFREKTKPFLNLGTGLERNLIAFYKMHNCTFPHCWTEGNAFSWASKFDDEWRDDRNRRDAENRESFVIDQILEFLRRSNHASRSTMLHSWELAMLSRRQRAVALSSMIADAFTQLKGGREFRYFAFFNQATSCWLVFSFFFGASLEEVLERLHQLARRKAIVEVELNKFQYSVFGYAFRKSRIDTGVSFDDLAIDIVDADNCLDATNEERKIAFEFFGATRATKITEFPT